MDRSDAPIAAQKMSSFGFESKSEEPSRKRIMIERYAFRTGVQIELQIVQPVGRLTFKSTPNKSRQHVGK